MTSRERILAAIDGRPHDHVPLTTWCFGFQAPADLRWTREGKEIERWYSMRMEHIHTIPRGWQPADDFQRVQAWLSLGVDDVIDVSLPWSIDPEVSWQDSARKGTGKNSELVREYCTPSGTLMHAVRKTEEKQAEGWVVQPDYVPLFEDFNIPRAVEHAVSSPRDVPLIAHLYQPPNEEAKAWFAGRMQKVKTFADRHGVAVQAWSGFGMDAVVWLAGTEGAIMMAVDHARAFMDLMEIITQTDLGRTELAASTPGVDIVVARGWYSGLDFWSPDLFNKFVYSYVQKLAAMAHRHGKKFGYTMTTGVEILGGRLAEAGVDILYFIDPVQDDITIEKARDLLGERMTLVGGTNALTLASKNADQIEREVRRAIDVLGPTNRFILHPVDAIFPDTPWQGIEKMIEVWQKHGDRSV